MSIFVESMMAIGAYFGYYAIKNRPKSKKNLTLFYAYNSNGGNRRKIAQKKDSFYNLIVIYIAMTFLVGLFYALVDISKLFGVLAIGHNVLEFVLLVWILSGGIINYSKWAPFFLIYLSAAGLLIVLLKWPYDGIFFRIQGLTLDLMLFIEITRTYFTTHFNLIRKNRISLVDIDDEDEEQQNLENDDDDDVDDDEIEYNNDVNEKKIFHHPHQFLILILATFIHALGNIVNTFSYDQQIPILLFQFSYAIAFTLFAYYIYVDVRISAKPFSKKIIYLPSNSPPLVFTIFILSISFILVVVRVGLLIQSRKHGDHNN